MTQLQFEVAFFSDDSQISSQAIPGIYTGLGGTQVDVAPQFLPHPSWSHVCSWSVNSVLWGHTRSEKARTIGSVPTTWPGEAPTTLALQGLYITM